MSRLGAQPGELIDRNAPLRFNWNGRQLSAFHGDTIASALVANGVRVVSRSMKYHRPRGYLTADYWDPNGFVQVGDDPNVRSGHRLVEAGKEYVQAARIIGLPSWLIMLRHILPNTLRPVLVIATIGLALAIIAEATLSFLGQGIPPTTPSLGTLIRVGNEYLFSGLWWITFFPAIALVVLVFAVTLLGDWMRDALNPKLR